MNRRNDNLEAGVSQNDEERSISDGDQTPPPAGGEADEMEDKDGRKVSFAGKISRESAWEPIVTRRRAKNSRNRLFPVAFQMSIKPNILRKAFS